LNTITYGLQERPRGAVLFLSTFQWLIFTLANVVTVPIVLGHAFGLQAHEIALYANRTFFVCGVIGILQVMLGHRYAIIEGPAGMWWGVFTVLIQMTQDRGGSLFDLQQDLEFGLLIAGLLYIGLAVFKLLDVIRHWFTPIVTGTFLVLLALQLSRSLMNGMLGIGYQGHQSIVPTITVMSLALVCLMMGLMTRGKGMVKSLAILITLLIGWILYILMGYVSLQDDPAIPTFAVPTLLPWGKPTFHLGIVLTSILTALILLSNIISSIQAFAGVVNEQALKQTYDKGTMMSGVGSLLAGLFGTVGCVPLAVAAGFVSLTGIASRLPFLLASIAVAVLGLFPKVGQLVATLPAPVGYAALFTVFGQLLGFGLLDIKKLALNQRDLFVISIPLMAGVGIFFVPGQAWLSLPPLLGYILGNGLIVGVVLVLVLEHIIFRKKPDKDLPVTH
jgi:xanthine/uracil permease